MRRQFAARRGGARRKPAPRVTNVQTSRAVVANAVSNAGSAAYALKRQRGKRRALFLRPSKHVHARPYQAYRTCLQADETDKRGKNNAKAAAAVQNVAGAVWLGGGGKAEVITPSATAYASTMFIAAHPETC